MRIFREYQIGLMTIGEVDVKEGDESLVTVVDRDIEMMILGGISNLFPGIRVIGEEGGQNSGTGEYYIYVDPADGTRELANGTTLSVIIIAVMRDDTVVGCTIAEPASGRLWTAWEGEGCRYYLYDYVSHSFREECERQCCVWEGEFSTQSTVYVDSSQGYRRGDDGRQMFTDEQNARFYALLNHETHVRVLGPNGQIQALLANGSKGVAGAVTLAKGWPWDAAGVRLVIEAGGAATAFAIVDGKLVERPALDVNCYDFLVAGNNSATVEKLTDALASAYFG